MERLPSEAARPRPGLARLWAAWVLALASPAALLVLVVSAVWTPEAMAAGEPLRLLGLQPTPCAGCGACGLSRAFAALTHLRLAEALAFNPTVLLHYPLVLSLALAGPFLSLRLFRGGHKP